MANNENIDKLINLIESEKVLFRMEHWVTHNEKGCGTVACIAGHVCLLIASEDLNIKNVNDEDCLHLADSHHLGFKEVREYLDIDTDEFYSICYPYNWDHVGKYSKEDAVNMLKHFKETGEVKWK